MFYKDLDLTNLVPLEEWQRFQDGFAEALEVGLRTVSPSGKLISKVSRPNYLCEKLLPTPPGNLDPYAHCILQQGVNHLSDIKEKSNFKCPFALDLFLLPVTAAGIVPLAHIIVGPLILNRRQEISQYAQEAHSLGISLETLMDALVEISVFSYNKIYLINKIVRDVFSYIVQSGYHKKRLGEMAPEIMKMDPLFLRYYEEKILNAMLNSCVLGLDADSGSIMTVDENTNHLHIKAANRLDKDIVEKTDLKIGEGIAGYAAAIAEPIILPEDKTKSGLSERMKRDYIKSSMIVPFPKGKTSNVYGVINLNMVRKDVSFSQKDIAFVQELLNLASTALVPFQQPPSP